MFTMKPKPYYKFGIQHGVGQCLHAFCENCFERSQADIWFWARIMGSRILGWVSCCMLRVHFNLRIMQNWKHENSYGSILGNALRNCFHDSLKLQGKHLVLFSAQKLFVIFVTKVFKKILLWWIAADHLKIISLCLFSSYQHITEMKGLA